MSELPGTQTFELAQEHHRSGRLREAESLYRQILIAEPNNADAMQLLGVLSLQTGRAESGIALLRKAITINPSAAHYHLNLGIGLLSHGHPQEAANVFLHTIELAPDSSEAHFNLANAFRQAGNQKGAFDHFRRAIELNPNHAEAHNNLANLLREAGRLDDATACYQNALRANPQFAEALNNLGSALAEKGRFDDALGCYQRAVAMKSNYLAAHMNLASEMHRRGQFEAAIAGYQRALQINPKHAETHYNLGNVFSDKVDLESAAASYRRAIELRPDWHKPYNNLATAVKDMGQLDSAIAAYKKALQLKPDYTIAHSNLVYTLHFHPDSTAQSILEEHKNWNAIHAEPLREKILPHTNDKNAERKIRVGYISPDFRTHVVGMNLLPLLENHDHTKFEIFCYADVRRPDPMTEKCKSHADQWRNILGRSDEQVAALIREDQIDILIDLTLHMAHNRMLVFARKPAPVQMTYLGYVSTTGLATMDYRLTDPHLDPSGADLKRYVEKTVRLPQTYWCYQPLGDMPDVAPPPAQQTGHITLGCMNNFCKVTSPTIDAWMKILRAVPNSRLLLSAPHGEHLNALRDRFADHDVTPDRIEFLKKRPWDQYVQSFQRIDISLDPFPYGGGITTCDSLFMGVPVITLAGDLAVGRGGVSILNNIGLPEFVASDITEYIRLAVALANDKKRLADLRLSIRERMRRSPLMDAVKFARTVEAAFQIIWDRWRLKSS